MPIAADRRPIVRDLIPFPKRRVDGMRLGVRRASVRLTRWLMARWVAPQLGAGAGR